jgi:hypothetical protein
MPEGLMTITCEYLLLARLLPGVAFSLLRLQLLMWCCYIKMKCGVSDF